jgi:hypothetical protein
MSALTTPNEGNSAIIGNSLQLRARAWLMWLTRAIWALIVLQTLLVFTLTISARYSQLVIIGAENSIAFQQLGVPQWFVANYIAFFDGLVFLAYAIIGAMIFRYKSREWIGLFASLTLITTAVSIIRPGDSLLFAESILRIPLLLTQTIGIVCIIIFLYIFPDGRFMPRWTRWIAIAFTTFASYFYLTPIVITDPLPWPPPNVPPVLVVGIVLGVAFQVVRYKLYSTDVQREQTRWVILGLIGAAVGLAAFLLLVPLLVPQVLRPSMSRALYVLIGVPLFYVALALFPIALGISFRRHHLWNVDLLLNRTLVYLPLTAILAGLFEALEFISRTFFNALTGEGSDLATIVSTLLVAAAFAPIKDFLQGLVDKRFKEAPDPAKHLDAFRAQVQARVSPIYPPQMLRRFLDEAAQAYNVTGGAAFLQNKAELVLLKTVGEWDNDAQVRVPMQMTPTSPLFGQIALGKRKNGAPFTDADIETLCRIAQTVSCEIEEDLTIAE